MECRVAVAVFDGVLGPPREGVEARAVRIAEVLPDAVCEQLTAVVAADRVAEATGVRAVGAAIEQRAAERLEAAARDVDRTGPVGARTDRQIGHTAEQEDLVAEDEVVGLVA